MIKSIVNYFSSIVMATVVLKSVPGSNQYWETRVTELFGDYFMLARIYLVFLHLEGNRVPAASSCRVQRQRKWRYCVCVLIWCYLC